MDMVWYGMVDERGETASEAVAVAVAVAVAATIII